MRLLHPIGDRLYRKYVATFALLIGAVLLAGGGSDLYFAYYETRDATVALNHEKAVTAAIRIEQFIHEIEQHIGWTSLLSRSADPLSQRHTEFIKLLRQAPAVTDALWLDANGREQLRVSRLLMDRLHSNEDYSQTPAFVTAQQDVAFRGPVYFRKDTEPYMTLAAKAGEGVTMAEVNLKFVWDVIASVHFEKTGHAYVVGSQGHLISHPDISLVLKNTDMSALPQVQHALIKSAGQSEDTEARDIAGHAVITAHAYIEPLGWTVFVEQDAHEAFAPLYASIKRTALLMLLGLLLALGASALLARRMVKPIRALQEGAARIGAGELEHRIEVHTHDELQTLAEEFDHMATRLRESYAGLEQKVAERTAELVTANRAKSRFLAAASHDLRQPMHALGLFVSQLTNRVTDPDTKHLANRVESAVSALQGLLDALLDVSRLDAGVVTPNIVDFSANSILERIENAFAADATDRELRFRIVRTTLMLKSDPLLLERILINLVANAMRYTENGGVLVGCRRRGKHVRIEVWDSGIGISPEHQQAIFQEFYQIGNPERDRQKGLGLGLSIAARLALLLGGRIDVRSQPGHGSVFAVEIPRGESVLRSTSFDTSTNITTSLHNTTVLVIDDDALVCEALAGLITQWGGTALTASCGKDALTISTQASNQPNVVLCDYRLPAGETGDNVIKLLREHIDPALPAALITGDTAPERLREANKSGVPLLHKPVQPARLRALLEHLIATQTNKLAT